MNQPQSGFSLSVILPVFNEVANIETVYSELALAIEQIPGDKQIIFVDDGSSDGTSDLLTKIAERDNQVVVITFRRNFGQTAAMAAGFDYSKGDVVVTMDADLQNDPNDIPILIKKMEEGYDLVAGWRFDRKDGFILRRLPSMLANHLISWTTDVKLHDYGCTLKAFRKEVIKGIDLYGEMHRFIPAIASWMGIRLTELKVNHRPRIAGFSKYGISRTVRVVLDLITVKYLLSYSSRPLQLFGLLGLLSGGAGALITSYLVFIKLFLDQAIGGRPMLIFGIFLMFMGLQFITVGLLGEMQTRIYHETQRKSVYVVRDLIIRGEKKQLMMSPPEVEN
ncbi:MAG: glycosyltransferase [Acidiferrobacteraceae bacterium]|jgi:glycosyltransferase involved in cell wall biosynthesis|nr:glycosyltransferase [Acidiferrobacteraceae bacterium]|tara:strand:- start:3255 stop:4262 length:1008 start_codon:yes stop_codon:yes gene_type:complete